MQERLNKIAFKSIIRHDISKNMEIEKLDTLLLLMNEQEEHQIVTPDMAESFVSRADYAEYAKRLTEDRLAVLLDKKTEFMMLTEKGIQFIKAGGYSKAQERSRSVKKKQRRLALLFAYLGIGVALSFLFFKIFMAFQNN
jgi:hypothetical protein